MRARKLNFKSARRAEANLPGAARRVNLLFFEPITISLTAPPTTPVPWGWALFGFGGVPSAADATTLPAGLGTMAFLPQPMNGAHPLVFTIADSFGIPGATPLMGAGPLTWSLSIPFGVSVGVHIALQGVIADSSQPLGLAITNGVVLHIGP